MLQAGTLLKLIVVVIVFTRFRMSRFHPVKLTGSQIPRSGGDSQSGTGSYREFINFI